MHGILPPLRIQVTKTADGKLDYLQITSSDQFSLNIVLIAEEITVEDCREQPKAKSPSKSPSKPPSKRRRKRGVQS